MLTASNTASQVDELLRALPATALESAVLAAGIGVWHWDLMTDTISYSTLARSISGLPEDGPIAVAMIHALTHPEDYPRTMGIFRRAIDPATRSSEIYTYRIIRPDTGETRWVQAHGLAKFGVVDGVEVALTYSGSIQDVTERHVLQAALVEQDARLRLAIEAGQMAVWDIDIATDKLTVSPELNRLFGFPADATPSASDFRSLYAPGEEERLNAVSAEQLATGGNKIQSEVRYILRDGQERTLLLRAQIQPDKPPYTRAIGVLIDVTERVRHEQRVTAIAMEMRHRLKNAFAVIGAIASRSWPREDRDEGLNWFQGRLRAISAATDLMFQPDSDTLLISDLADRIVAPYRSPDHDPFVLEGPRVTVPSALATPVAMALHELATNAIKYGALSTPEGQVKVRWNATAESGIGIVWQEMGGPSVTQPTRTGFGSTLLSEVLFPAPHEVDHAFEASGVRCAITLRPD